jgi:hypothetical protein
MKSSPEIAHINQDTLQCVAKATVKNPLFLVNFTFNPLDILTVKDLLKPFKGNVYSNANKRII